MALFGGKSPLISKKAWRSKSYYKEEPVQLELPLESVDDKLKNIDHLQEVLQRFYVRGFMQALKYESLQYDIENNEQLKEMWDQFQMTRKLIYMGGRYDDEKKEHLRSFSDCVIPELLKRVRDQDIDSDCYDEEDC